VLLYNKISDFEIAGFRAFSIITKFRVATSQNSEIPKSGNPEIYSTMIINYTITEITIVEKNKTAFVRK
jgi:hypothetical protein